MRKMTFFWICFLFSGRMYSQSIIITPSKVESNSSAKPIVIPRLTISAILNISSPNKGTLVYDISNKILRMYDGSKWIKFKSFETEIYPTAPFSFSKKDEESNVISPTKTSLMP